MPAAALPGCKFHFRPLKTLGFQIALTCVNTCGLQDHIVFVCFVVVETVSQRGPGTHSGDQTGLKLTDAESTPGAELTLEMAVSHLMWGPGPTLQSSGRTARALNC